MTATLCFVAKGVHAALGAQVRVGAGLELVVVATWGAGRIEITRLAWCIVAWAAVVELTGWTSTLALSISRLAIAITSRTLAAAWRAVTELGALTIACGAIAHTVTADMATGAWGATFGAATLATATTTRVATAASSFGIANALHHFAARGFGCSSHHVTAWWLA